MAHIIMSDQRNRRAWIHVQLPDSPAGYDAARIVNDWKRQRRGSINLISAIRLYAALLAGDTSVLFDLFPGLGFYIGGAAPARRPGGNSAAPEVIHAPSSPETEEEDLIDMLGDIDFS
jgi:hypothetical protein